MGQSDKKSDDHDAPSASWVAKHTPGYRTQYAQPSPNRTPRNHSLANTTPTTTNVAAHNQSYYPSARHWQPQRQLHHSPRAYTSEKGARNDSNDDLTCAEFCDLESDRSCPAVTARLPRSKPFRRLFLALVGVLALGYFCWRQAVGPLVGAEWHIKEGFVRTQRGGTYGFAMGGDFQVEKDRIQRLDDSLLPGGVSDPDARRRLIFVGDIHGCKSELLALLEACAFDSKTDHLIATGDVISKGPDSPGVVDELIRLNATSVRGNHEDRILTLANVKSDPDFNGMKSMSSHASKDTTLLKSLHQRHIDYLQNMPLILRIPALPLAHTSGRQHSQKHDTITTEILVVHAGLAPAVPLRKQDAFSVMNMRSLARRTHVPSSSPSSRDHDTLPWFELWNWYNGRVDKGETLMDWREVDSSLDQSDSGDSNQIDKHQQSWTDRLAALFDFGPFKKRRHHRPRVVVYGHDSKAGLLIKRWSKGLDSGAVRGGELTAMVLDARGQFQIVSVQSKDYTSH